MQQITTTYHIADLLPHERAGVAGLLAVLRRMPDPPDFDVGPDYLSVTWDEVAFTATCDAALFGERVSGETSDTFRWNGGPLVAASKSILDPWRRAWNSLISPKMKMEGIAVPRRAPTHTVWSALTSGKWVNPSEAADLPKRIGQINQFRIGAEETDAYKITRREPGETALLWFFSPLVTAGVYSNNTKRIQVVAYPDVVDLDEFDDAFSAYLDAGRPAFVVHAVNAESYAGAGLCALADRGLLDGCDGAEVLLVRLAEKTSPQGVMRREYVGTADADDRWRAVDLNTALRRRIWCDYPEAWHTRDQIVSSLIAGRPLWGGLQDAHPTVLMNLIEYLTDRGDRMRVIFDVVARYKKAEIAHRMDAKRERGENPALDRVAQKMEDDAVRQIRNASRYELHAVLNQTVFSTGAHTADEALEVLDLLADDPESVRQAAITALRARVVPKPKRTNHPGIPDGSSVNPS